MVHWFTAVQEQIRIPAEMFFFILNIPSACCAFGIASEEAGRELQIEQPKGQEEEEPDGNKENPCILQSYCSS